MKNNHNDHGRRLEFLEKVYREDRERWKKNDEQWKGHYRQVNLTLGLIRDQGKRTDELLQEVKRQGDELKRQGDRLEGVVRRHHRKSEQ